MLNLIRITTDTYGDGVKHFLASLGWTYLTYRYPPDVQAFTLLALTVSKLDPWAWERCVMHLASQPGGDFARLLNSVRLSPLEMSALPRSVDLIRAYAQQQKKPLVDAPTAPTYLEDFGLSHQYYLQGLEQVYGLPLEPQYFLPWPDSRKSRTEPPLLLQPNLLRRAMAVMGATAGAIDQLMTMGADNGQHN